MADGGDSADRAASILQKEGLLPPTSHCNICREPFKEVEQTVLLPCGHTVCRGCATNEVQDVKKLVCPVCQREVPNVQKKADVARLLPNLFVQVSQPAHLPCVECLQYGMTEEEAAPAIASCSKCDAHFCGEHQRIHQRAFEKKGHVTQPLLAPPNGKFSRCQSHDDPFQGFCGPCVALVCQKCIFEHHFGPGHYVSFLDCQAVSLSLTLLKAQEAGHRSLRQLEAVMDQYPTTVLAIKDQGTWTDQKIRQAFASLHQLLTAREQELLTARSRATTEDLASLESALCGLQRRWLGLYSSSTLADHLLKPGATPVHVGWYGTAISRFLQSEAQIPVAPLPLMREGYFELPEAIVQAAQCAGCLILGTAYGPNCTAEGLGLTSAYVLKLQYPSVLKVTARDRLENTLTSGGDRIELRAVSANSDAVNQLDQMYYDHGNGTYSVTYRYCSSVACLIYLHVLLNGQPIRGSPFQVQVLDRLLLEVKNPGYYDNAGILYYLGTSAGQQPWRNPHEAGLVAVTASGIESGNVSAIVANQESWFCTAPSSQAWIAIDFTSHRVIPTAYTFSCVAKSMRPDGLPANDATHKIFLRSWILEGSIDGKTWQELRKHLSDTSLSETKGTAQWAIEKKVEPVRYLRIRLLPSRDEHALFSRSGTAAKLAISGLEIYGWLY